MVFTLCRYLCARAKPEAQKGDARSIPQHKINTANMIY